ncbi:MAG: hypothetical protein LKI80_05125 [Sporolactobacillus sp.]|nr:hypothetical protein [Sporolactobacillus sp.]
MQTTVGCSVDLPEKSTHAAKLWAMLQRAAVLLGVVSIRRTDRRRSMLRHRCFPYRADNKRVGQ